MTLIPVWFEMCVQAFMYAMEFTYTPYAYTRYVDGACCFTVLQIHAIVRRHEQTASLNYWTCLTFEA